MGDALWATPSVKALKNALPHAEISLLTSPIGALVFENNPSIASIFVFRGSFLRPLISLVKKLRESHFDAVLIYHASQRIVFPLCALTNAPVIIGTKGLCKGLDSLLTKALPQKVQHEIERRLEITNALTPISSDGLLEMHLTQEEAQPFYNENYIVIHPGSKDPFRRWDKRHFIAVGKWLAEKHGRQIVVSGNKEEEELAQEVAEAIPRAVHIAGKLSLRRFAGVVKECKMVLTNDTGPMHLALAMKTPLVAIFCPSDPKLFGPYKAKNALIIKHPPTCTPCIKRKCRDSFCFEQIAPQEVIEAIETFLHTIETEKQNG